jgi:predicted nucleic acid-binding protein
LVALIVDNSVTAAWAFEDEASDYTEALLDRVGGEPTVVPSVCPFEVASALVMGIRRGRIAPDAARQFAVRLSSLPIEVESSGREQVLGAVFELAVAHGPTAYDAAYLELATRRGLPLASRDERLRRAAGRLGVTLL